MPIFTHIEQLENVLNEALLAEFEAQGHAMTGALIKEIQYKVSEEVNKIVLSGFMYPYGNYLSFGVKSDKIPFGGTAPRGQGKGGTSLYIQALQRYAQARMNISDEKKSLSVAFAIAKTQKKEGMPTKGSYRFTDTGKRTDFVEEALKKNEDKIADVISQLAFESLTVSFDVLINKWQTELNR